MPPTIWCPRRLVVTIDGPEGRQAVATEKPFARIGCHQSSEVVLVEQEARLRSLYLHATDQGIYCASLLPPWLDRPRFNGWIAADEALSLGAYRIAASFADGAPPEVALPDLLDRGSAGPNAPELEITARTHDQEPTRRRLSRRLTLVGRSEPASLCLGNRTVSRIHCALYWDGAALWVVDLLSGNGTRLEGRLVETALLGPGESLELGDVQLTYLAGVEKQQTAAWNLPAPSGGLPREFSQPIVLIAHQRHEPPEHADEQPVAEASRAPDTLEQPPDARAAGRAETAVIPPDAVVVAPVESNAVSPRAEAPLPPASLSPWREPVSDLGDSAAPDDEVDLLDRLVDRQTHIKRMRKLRLALYAALAVCGILLVAAGLAGAVWMIIQKSQGG